MILKNEIIVTLAILQLFGCALNKASQQPLREQPLQNIERRNPAIIALHQLPFPISNNAVAIAQSDNGKTLYSFLGLGTGKTFNDISKAVFACPLNETRNRECKQLDDVPVTQGRLASIAVTVGNSIYLFGGYTVAPDGGEVSTPDVLQFQPQNQSWTQRAPMPTPVDDMVAFTHLERYIYLVSGWHNEGNVSLTQVFDTQENRWFRATDFPGQPVFGHSGGVVNGNIVITDGVAVISIKEGRRQFGLINDSWFGEIDRNDPAIIRWRKIPAHPFGPLYRMAATGDSKNGLIVFAGGGDNAYNYNGIGYDGTLTKPSDKIFAYDINSKDWTLIGTLENPSMDHRGLLTQDSHYIIMGGMGEGAKILKDIISLPRPIPPR